MPNETDAEPNGGMPAGSDPADEGGSPEQSSGVPGPGPDEQDDADPGTAATVPLAETSRRVELVETTTRNLLPDGREETTSSTRLDETVRRTAVPHQAPGSAYPASSARHLPTLGRRGAGRGRGPGERRRSDFGRSNQQRERRGPHQLSSP